MTLVALGIGPGDEVIVPTLTYIASVNAIKYTGAMPVLVDSCMDTWQMDPEDVRTKMTERTKAIMVVHLYGHPFLAYVIRLYAQQGFRHVVLATGHRAEGIQGCFGNGEAYGVDISYSTDCSCSRTMVPLRFAAENLGCLVGWDQPTKGITVAYGG